MREWRQVGSQPSRRSVLVCLTGLAAVALLAAAYRQQQRTPARARRLQQPIEPWHRDLLSVLAHELRTPLNSIVGRLKDGDPRDAEFEVGILDTGQGIDPEFLPLVFERFEQAARSGRRHDGLGLGLAICRDVIEEHHG